MIEFIQNTQVYNLRNTILTIIYNNQTIVTDKKDLSSLLPIFSMTKDQFNNIKEYEINKENHNYFANINCNKINLHRL